MNSNRNFLRTHLLVFAFICLAFRSHGQNEHEVSQHIRAGFILGMNASQVDGDDYAGYHKVGLNFGFYGQLPVSKIFFLSTEILYSQKGAKSRTYQGLPLEYQINLQYAEIPVLFHYQDKKAFNVGVGLSYSRLLKEEEWFRQEPNPPIPICTAKPIDADLLNMHFVCLRRGDYNVMAEANYLATKHLAINVRFAYSLPPMGYRGSSNFINRGMYNNLLSFRAMWIFGS